MDAARAGAPAPERRAGTHAASLLLCALVVYVSLVPYPFIGGAELAGVPAPRLVPFGMGVILFLLAIYGRRGEGGRGFGDVFLAAPLLWLVAAQAFGSIGSVEPMRSLSKAVFYFFTGIAFYLGACRLKPGARAVLWSVAAASCAAGAFSTVEFFLGRTPLLREMYALDNPYYFFEALRGRSFGTLGHPVFTGGLFVLAAPAIFYLLDTERGKYLKAVLAVFLCVSLAGALFTFSRGAIVSIAVSAFVFYRRALTKRRLAWLLVPVVIAIGALAFSGRAGETLGGRLSFSGASQAGDLTHRLMAYELAGRVLADAPLFGMGVGNYRHLYGKYRVEEGDTRAVYATPDNMYLVTLAETGMLGLGLFVYILYTAYAALGARARAGGTLQLAALAMLAGFMVDMLFFDALYVEPLRAVFWTVLGTAFADGDSR
ncbi:MAG TPA: O-antigen ligase family protein [Nitrospirota bacterium]|nr:O-antigen ligase family protein [Nitrospirota bacterium]